LHVNRILTHIVHCTVQGLSAVNCVKTAEPSRYAVWDADSGGFREHVLHGV